MKPKTVTWNVRGLNDVDKRLRIRNMIREWKVDIVCLQETKLNYIDRGIVRSLWSGVHVDWAYLASNGASGGIVVLWDRRVVERVEEFIGNYTVACSFKSIADNYLWAFAGVYGANLDKDRSLLWDELVGIHNWWDLPWCIGGDFNVVRFPSEASGSRRLRPAMEAFSECIFDLNLIDLPLAGGTATWSNNQSWSRLDRFLISPEWECHFPEVWLKRLPRIGSDHWPVLLDCGGIRKGRWPFKFENMWLKSEGFVDRVKQWWSSYQFQGTPSFIFASKLKALKKDLQVWNVESFGNVGEMKKAKLLEIQEIERLQVVQHLTQAE
ncbi:hypothetical protein CIPAW_07G008100 [Carya illinoinensis]|uniref:Endonuclease/exonuclease/phosphatase domain-containing protein n=1 Tax=Carya illinoinensis TaxID=32201 RepID=A0A8T1PTG2_CARIL|nr:hypothetical protein CIPAW_07G008100 [Carya illinoinensis]